MLYLYRKKEKGIPILIAALRPASLIKTKVFFLFHSSRHKNQLFQQKKHPHQSKPRKLTNTQTEKEEWNTK